MSNKQLELVNSNDSDVEPIDEVHDTTEVLIHEAIESYKSTLVGAMPAAGKTFSCFKIIEMMKHASGKKFTYVTERSELFKEAKQKCEDRDLESYILPSINRDCPSADKESDIDDKHRQDIVELLDGHGLTGSEIHESLDLPCKPDCPYTQKWEEFDPDTDEVLIGNYIHAHLDGVVEDRVVIFDEFPGQSFMTHFKHPRRPINKYVQQRGGLPFNNITDVLMARQDDQQRREAITWFNEHGTRENGSQFIDSSPSDDDHTKIGKLVASLLIMDKVDSRFDSSYGQSLDKDLYPFEIEKSDILGNSTCAYDRNESDLWLLEPPNLDEAESVVGLDGTPNQALWNEVLDCQFRQKDVVENGGKDEYVHDTLNISVHQPSDVGVKAYHDGYIACDKDKSLLNGLEMKFGQKAALITTKNAKEEYLENGVMDFVGEFTNYARIHSSNKFNGEEVGMVSGSPHPGDDPIRAWCAVMGYPSDTGDRGMDLDYGPMGNSIYKHLVHNEVLQAILRFSRDASGAHVIVNTALVPDWLTFDDLEMRNFTNSDIAVMQSLQDSEEGMSQSELVEVTGKSQQTISSVLTGMENSELVKAENNPGPYPNLYRWVGE